MRTGMKDVKTRDGNGVKIGEETSDREYEKRAVKGRERER